MFWKSCFKILPLRSSSHFALNSKKLNFFHDLNRYLLIISKFNNIRIKIMWMSIMICSNIDMFRGIFVEWLWKIDMPNTAYSFCFCLFVIRFCSIITLIFALYSTLTKRSIRISLNTIIYDIKSLLLCPTLNNVERLISRSKCFPFIKKCFS